MIQCDILLLLLFVNHHILIYLFFGGLNCRRAIEIDEEEDDKNVLSVPSQELNVAISELSSRLESLRTCNDLIAKQGRLFQTTLSDLESGDDSEKKISKLVTERATLFRIASKAMVNVSTFKTLKIRNAFI